MKNTATLLLALFSSIPSSTVAWVVPSSSLRDSSPLFASTKYTLDGQEIRGPITPLGNFLFVRTKDTLMATAGGILLPDQAKERPTEGVVVAAGPGKLHPHSGKRIQNPVSEGLSVLFGKFDGTPIEYQEDQCQVIRDDDVLLYYDGNIMNLENAVPCRDYILVSLPDKEQDTTSSGIVVSSQVTAELLPCEGVVVKLGEGRLASNGEFSKTTIQEGDLVKFKDYAGNDVTIDGKPYSLVRMVDVLATIKQDEE